MGDPKDPSKKISFKFKLTPKNIDYLETMAKWLSNPQPENSSVLMIGPAGCGKNTDVRDVGGDARPGSGFSRSE